MVNRRNGKGNRIDIYDNPKFLSAKDFLFLGDSPIFGTFRSFLFNGMKLFKKFLFLLNRRRLIEFIR